MRFYVDSFIRDGKVCEEHERPTCCLTVRSPRVTSSTLKKPSMDPVPYWMANDVPTHPATIHSKPIYHLHCRTVTKINNLRCIPETVTRLCDLFPVWFKCEKTWFNVPSSLYVVDLLALYLWWKKHANCTIPHINANQSRVLWYNSENMSYVQSSDLERTIYEQGLTETGDWEGGDANRKVALGRRNP